MITVDLEMVEICAAGNMTAQEISDVLGIDLETFVRLRDENADFNDALVHGPERCWTTKRTAGAASRIDSDSMPDASLPG